MSHECDASLESFSSKGLSLAHGKHHKEEQHYLCHICNLSFSQEKRLTHIEEGCLGDRDMLGHIQDGQPTGWDHSCSHLSTVTEPADTEAPNEVKLCGASPSTLHHHDGCGKAPHCRKNLCVHEKMHSLDYLLQSNTSPKEFKSKTDFKINTQPFNDKRSFLYRECGKTSRHLSLLKSHNNIHIQKKYSCRLCGKSYHYQASLFTHMHTHTTNRPYKCGKCAGSFLVKSHLHEHLKIHSNKRPFLCEVCGKGFKFLSVLKSHLTIHTREKKYICHECGKSYRQRASLYIHMRTHTGHRPYKCDQCAAAFLVKSHLLDHQRTHSGEKPFECEVCSARFSRTPGLQKHLKGHIKRGLKVDLKSAMHKAKLSARVKPTILSKYLPDSRPSCQSKKKDTKTIKNVMICPGFLPDDEVHVVLTLSSIGDGSACSHSIEKQRAETKLSEIIMCRSFPANEKNIQTHNQGVMNGSGKMVWSRKTHVGSDGDGKHQVSYDQPECFKKYNNTKAGIINTSSGHKHNTEVVDLDPESPRDPVPPSLVSYKAKAQGSTRSVDILHVESNNTLERKNTSKPTYNHMPEKIKSLNVHEELCEKSKKNCAEVHGTCASETKVDGVHSEHVWEYPLEQTAPVWKRRKSKHKPLQSSHDYDALHHIFTQKAKDRLNGVEVASNTEVDSFGPQLLPPTFSAPCHNSSESPVHSVKYGEGNVLPLKRKLSNQLELHSDPHQYVCARCDKVVQQTASLARHHCNLQDSIPPWRRTHLPETKPDQSDLHVCEQCGKTFKNRFVLKVQYRNHTGEKPFVCQECNKFISATHKRQQTSVQPSQSQLCRKPHKQKMHFQQHLRVNSNKTETARKDKDIVPQLVMICIEPENGMLVCDVHEQNHLNSAGLDHPAETRHQALSDTSEIESEDQNLLYETEGVFELTLESEKSCPIKKNPRNKSSENTGEVYEKEIDNPQEAQVQGESRLWEDKASRPSQLRSQKLLMCRYCPKSFRYSSAVTSHERSHTGEKPFVCPRCGKGFSKKSNMETHARMHTGERPFLCEYCGKHFSHKYTLTAHRHIHTKEKPFECEICGKSFWQETSRRIHLKRHAGEKNFRCDFCPKAFVTKVELQDHRRTHTKERPYRCDLCGSRFSVHHHLTDHRRLHGGDRRHKCQFCSMTFMHARSWKQHMQKHTHLMKDAFQ